MRKSGPGIPGFYRCLLDVPQLFPQFPSPNPKKIQALVEIARFLKVLLGCKEREAFEKHPVAEKKLSREMFLVMIFVLKADVNWMEILVCSG